MSKRLGRLTRWIGIVLVAVALAGGVIEAVAAQWGGRSHPAPGRLVDIGGRKLHLECAGQGGPTVILEAGAARSSLTWAKVLPEIARTNRVCAYDRAGTGWSDPAGGDRDGAAVAADLHLLLEKAGEKGPYLMVAHSFGGLYPRLYARQFPGQVAGILFVDAVHEDLLFEHGDEFNQSLPLLKAVSTLAPFGVVRLIGALGAVPWMEEFDRIPADHQAAFRATSLRTRLIATAYSENLVAEETARLNREAGDLGDLPIAVISAGRRKPGDWPDDAVWASVQAKLAALSTRSSQVIAAQSDHFVQLDEPGLVVEAVRLLSAQVAGR